MRVCSHRYIDTGVLCISGYSLSADNMSGRELVFYDTVRLSVRADADRQQTTLSVVSVSSGARQLECICWPTVGRYSLRRQQSTSYSQRCLHRTTRDGLSWHIINYYICTCCTRHSWRTIPRSSKTVYYCDMFFWLLRAWRIENRTVKTEMRCFAYTLYLLRLTPPYRRSNTM